jgi:hypothetical protein
VLIDSDAAAGLGASIPGQARVSAFAEDRIEAIEQADVRGPDRELISGGVAM